MRNAFPELRPFLAELRPWRGRLMLGTALMAATLLSAVGLLGLSGWFLTATAVAGLAGVGMEVYRPSAGIRFFALSRTLARYFERLVHHDAVLRVLARLRVRLFRTLLPLELTTLQRLRGSDLLNRVTADVETLDNLYLRILSPTLAAAFTVVVTSGVLSLFLGVHALPVIALLTLGGIALPALAWYAGRPPGRAVDTHLAALRGTATDAAEGLAELRASGALPRHRSRFLDAGARLAAARRRTEQQTGVSEAAVGLLAHAALFAALLGGVFLLAADGISGPQLALVALVALASGEALAALPGAWQHLGRTRDAARRLLEYETAPPDPPKGPSTGAHHRAAGDSAVFLQHVTFRHGVAQEPVLEDATLRIAPGEHVALQAPSGAGKSTALDLIAGFLAPERGRIRIGRHEVTTLPESERFARLAYLTQRTELYADTLAANLRLARPEATDDELDAVLERLGLNERVHALPGGLYQWIGEGGVRFSGGEARRIALARLMLSDPAVVLLDEPLRGLDERLAAHARDALSEWLTGRTALMASHQPDALPVCERTVVLRRRRFAAITHPVA